MTERMHQISMDELIVAGRVERQNPFVLRRMSEHSQKMSEVVDAVAKARSISADQIYGPCRRKDIAQARFEAVYIIFNTLPVSFRLAALGVGRSDHTTAMNSIKRVEDLRESDPEYSQYLDSLMDRLAS